MEKDKQAKPINKILKLLPKAASAVYFQNPPFSPSRDKRSDGYIHKVKTHAGKGFSGPIVSIIPEEVRRKHGRNGSMDEQEEPTSPKVSCMGQIKQKKKMCKAKRVSPPQETKAVSSSSSPQKVKNRASKKTFMRFFSSSKLGRKSDASNDGDFNVDSPVDRAPSLGQLKRFASGRDVFANFDWTSQIAPVESDHRDYYSDEERGEDYQEEDKVIIPFSAPMTIGGGGGGVALQPRKEVNLWKRRTMNPPRPLQLNSKIRAN